MTTTLDRPGRVLVLRGSPDHATAAIAEAIAAELVAAGLPVDVTVPSRVDGLAGYRAVVLGSRVRHGHWHPSVRRFLLRHAAVLTVRPLHLFAVGHEPVELLDGPPPVVFGNTDLAAPRLWALRIAADLVREPAGRM